MGAVPKNGGAPTQGLAFRFLTRYIVDTGRLLAQLEVVVGRAGVRLLRVGGRWYFLTSNPVVTRLLYMSGRRVSGLVYCRHVRNVFSL